INSIFRRLNLVGRGAYGAVYRGVHNSSGAVVALKVVNLDTPDDDVSDIQREVALLSQLRETEQRNVVRYWGCWLKGAELWIVMDFAEGGSVRTLMNAGPIQEKYACVIVRESLVALAYLHKSGIIHRDIKAANILLTVTGKVLLCDFGVAASLANSSSAKRTTFVGTPYWMAPEVITQGKSYDQGADIWSLGITIYEMVTGNPPLADQEQMRVIMLIPKNKPPRLPAEGSFSQPMRDFVAACLNEEPNERPNAEELQKHKWIKATAKVSTVLLKDLISQYGAWVKSG
ncbi:kinase-like protein, partial [Acaromyces ingoldii]